MHKACEHQQPLYMYFLDFKKVFDSISHDKLWVTIMDKGYPLHLIDLLAKLYRKQLAKVKVAGTLKAKEQNCADRAQNLPGPAHENVLRVLPV